MNETVIPRNAPDKLSPTVMEGVPYEQFAGMEFTLRRVPWSNVKRDEGSRWDEEVNGVAVGGGVVQPAVISSPAPVAGQTTAAFTVVTDVRDDGVNLQVKTRQITAVVTALGAESGWTTFAQTVTEC